MGVHPGGDGLAFGFFEGGAKGDVALEAALIGQLVGGEDSACTQGLIIESDEVLYAKAVDVGVVGLARPGEILAQISSVGANESCKLGKGHVMTQIVLLFHAVLLEKDPNL